MAVIAYGALGLWIGFVFGAVHLAIHFLGGGVPAADGSPMPPFLTFTVFVFYCGVGGLIIGFGRRLFLSRVGAAFLVSLGYLPVFVGIGVLYYGSAFSMNWLAVSLGAVGVGAPSGLVFRGDVMKSGGAFGLERAAEDS